MALPTIRVLSLFSGAAGLDLGLRIALPEARTVCYVEGDASAAKILAARIADGSLDDAPIWSDVRTFDGRRWRGAVDCIVGGFPCQDISVAGRQAGIVEGNRSGLWYEFARIIREVGPRFVFVENVGALLIRGIDIVLGDLAALGFDAEWGVFRASDVGAPHRRERVFVLAYRAERGFGVLRESSGGDGLTDGRGEGMEDSARDGQPGREREARGSGRRGVREAGEPMVHAERSERRQESEPRSGSEQGQHSGRQETDRPGDAGGILPDPIGARLEIGGGKRGDDEQEQQAIERSCLPLFPPGPADRDAWAAILRERPDLAPATQREVCDLADGMAGKSHRVDSLRALGNGVVPLQAALAFTVLARRAGVAC